MASSTNGNVLTRMQTALLSLTSGPLHDYQHDRSQDNKPNTSNLVFRLADVFTRTWYLGFTAFGGPPVHFGIFHRAFVEGQGGYTTWIDEQTYQDLFAVCQALPGPGSTKMFFCLVTLHAGLVPAVFCFLLWSLPGAIGMFLLALGVERINSTLPGPVYAVLSGLNASTVGIIALAAVQLASKSITDRMTRILVIGGACAGLCYAALWYFPLLMGVGGISTVIWDIWLSRAVGKLQARLHRRHRSEQTAEGQVESIMLEEHPEASSSATLRSRASVIPQKSGATATQDADLSHARSESPLQVDTPKGHQISVVTGIFIIIAFFVSFAAVLIARGVVNSPKPLALDLFANMYLAGTIIFGGGPVVIPLLREYVVEPGWVSPRDFLIGLAIIQAFPGPNFNFAVYLAALAIRAGPSPMPMAFGALLGYLGIFVPGITLALGVQGMWHVLRTKPVVASLLRGVNATAVGLVFTAVYRLWEAGYLTPSSIQGQSLAIEPWWVVVAAVSYSISAWFNVPAAIAILAGAILGLLWYAATGHNVLSV